MIPTRYTRRTLTTVHLNHLTGVLVANQPRLLAGEPIFFVSRRHA